MLRYGYIDLGKTFCYKELCNEWYPKISKFVSLFRVAYSQHLEPEDIVQELMLHLIEVSSKYRNAQTTFSTFAWTCLRNKMYTLIKQNKEKSLESMEINIDSATEELELRIDLLQTRLNRKQRFVFLALLKGYTKTEIAQKLRVTQSRISGIIKELEKVKKVVAIAA